MYEDLQKLPPRARPKMICLFPQGLVFFQSWRTLRWFLLMLVPVLVSAGASWARLQDGGLVIVVGLVGVAVASILFVELCSGMASSNWGTHFRSKEPGRYWAQVLFIALFYLMVSCMGFWG